MASGPTSTTRYTLNTRKRPRSEESEDDTGDSPTETESPNSSGGRRKTPQEISRWTEEILQGLNFIISYEEKTTPSDLLKLFPIGLQGPIKNRQNYFLLNYIDQIETFFLESLVPFPLLDGDFNTLSKKSADYLRFREAYDSSKFLNDVNASSELRLWFQRFEGYGIQFGKRLYQMFLKRDLKCTDNLNQDLICEYDFQRLFEDFAAMFGLETYCWSEPSLLVKKLQLPDVTVSGKADILYCWDIPNDAIGTLQEYTNIVAVCEVKKHSTLPDDESCRISRGSGTSTNTGCTVLPPHISLDLLGQHGGELLLYYPYSAKRKGNCILGMIIQETKVTFTALKMTPEQYDGILTGKKHQSRPHFILTKPYDFMKREERKFLIRPLLELALLQELKHVF